MSISNSNDSIYTNIYEEVMTTNYFFYCYIGGRGIGKTFSMLYNSYLNKDILMYMRTTEVMINECCSAYGNPYKDINLIKGTKIKMDKKGGIFGIIDEETENIIGYGHAVTTFKNAKGTGFQDVDIIFYDEFIDNSFRFQRQAEDFFNAIETINRNRELEGRAAVKVVLSSNATTLNSPLLRYLNLVEPIEKIRKENAKGIGFYTDKERGILIRLVENSKVKNKKKETALYKLVKGTSFYDFALENEFTNDYFNDVSKIKWVELIPLCAFNQVYFYRHKSKDIVYASNRKANCKQFFEVDKIAFMREYGFQLRKYKDFNQIIYQNYSLKLDVYDILK